MANVVKSVHLPDRPPESLWDVSIIDSTITSITSLSPPEESKISDNPDRTGPEAHPLLLPTLCHPHIHLDKPYLLCSSHPRYGDLIPTDGTFGEALSNTSTAKTRYDTPDLLLRGSQLIMESVICGVTSMRAFVEVDHVTQFKALEAAVELKQKFAKLCQLQIVAFAQDPVFSTEHGDENRKLLIEALSKYGEYIDVLGTTPYVEASDAASLENIEWAISMALAHGLHLDFHLDYNLDPDKKAYVWDVLGLLIQYHWTREAWRRKTVVLGHCTRLSLFSEDEMKKLADIILEHHLPVSFVGLPTSDLFMMGRPSDGGWGGQRPRGTLQVLEMISRFGINAAIGVNNVGNAFTPWGSVDPLRLASLGVGIYQAGTEKDADTLLACVSWRARAAIGLDRTQYQEGEARAAKEDSKGSWMLVKNGKYETFEVDGQLVQIPSRQYRTIRDVVWDPPEVGTREVVR